MKRKARNLEKQIAIVGMAGRFPGATNLDEFWNNLHEGRETISFFSKEEMLSAGIEPALLDNPAWVNAGGVLDGIELFDAGFFGFSPREAESLDPQQRLFLECAWEAFENGGLDPGRCGKSIGVYAGGAMSTYMFNLYRNPEFIRTTGYFQILIGNDKDYLPTRTAYKLNLRGPAIGVQSACSTSLVSVCLACQALQAGQCDVALAGGVNIRVPQKSGYYYQPLGIYSPDGHCRAFDEKGQGTVFGNGLGVVLLKRLTDALSSRDPIRAVILGSAINNDGSLKVGYTAPSFEGQVEVIAAAHAMAGVHPDTISYAEAHGTGTSLGDPVEISALTEAFQSRGSSAKNFCALGALKSNVGHLDQAAGIGGLIKAVLALENKEIPASLHFQRPNPEIDFENSPFYVNTKSSRWTARKGRPRRACVSAFGIGGTNAHMVLEEAPVAKPSRKGRSASLLMLSARTPAALDAASGRLAQFLRKHPATNLADLSFTLQTGRAVFNHRRFLVCRDSLVAASGLEKSPNQVAITAAESLSHPRLAFMFSGQGSQYPHMALGLYRNERTFRNHLNQCADILEPFLGIDLRIWLYPSPQRAAKAAEKLKQTELAQPALFAVEYALAKLWIEWGFEPQAMIGHSVGEYVAACLAGVFPLETALKLVAKRGQLMQRLPAGAMIVVALSESQVQQYLTREINLASVNDASLCVLSGPSKPVASLAMRLSASGVQCTNLHTSHAFHSAMMDSVLEPFANLVRQARPRRPLIPFVSNVSGTWISDREAVDPAYWSAHLRKPVRFFDGLTVLLRENGRVLIEVGPGITLTTFARRHPTKTPGQIAIPSLRHPREAHEDDAFLLDKLGRLWISGIQPDWNGFYRHERRNRIALPTYPFERQRYWIEPAVAASTAPPAPSRSTPGNISEWLYRPRWIEAPLPGISDRKRSTWLLFADGAGLARQMATQLNTAGEDVIVVEKAARFRADQPHSFRIDPKSHADYCSLVQSLRASGQLPSKIGLLWPLDGTAASSSIMEAQARDLGFYSLIFLTQALGEFAADQRVEIFVISSSMQRLPGDASSKPEKATLLGACKVIPQEHPQITCRSIDIEPLHPHGNGSLAAAARRLIDEIAGGTEPIVAWRGTRRWIQEIVSWGANPKRPLPLRDRGVYLITGGLGGIGMVLARFLASEFKSRLILITRSPLPRREEWADWVASHPDTDPTRRRIQELRSIEEAGGELLVVQADVADLPAMRKALRHALDRFGTLHGVIHAAGLAGGGIVALKTREAADAVLRAKVQGTLVLNDILQGLQIDFLLLCSSLTSIVGGAGQIDYCGANAFLDAFAHSASRDEKRLVVSVGWDTWKEVGMAVNTPVPAELKEQRQAMLERGLSTTEGIELFHHALRGTERQMIVSTTPLDRTGAPSLGRPSTPSETLAGHSRPPLETAYVAPRDEQEKSMARIWEELLGVAPVGINDQFFAELGGHSLLATQLVSRIKSSFRVDLPLRKIFDAPTISELAAAIRDLAQGGASNARPGLVPSRREARRGTLAPDGSLHISSD